LAVSIEYLIVVGVGKGWLFPLGHVARPVRGVRRRPVLQQILATIPARELIAFDQRLTGACA
jgi:hypothetical protein